MYYQCSSQKYGQAKCKTKSVNKKTLEELIVKSLNDYIFPEENLIKLADEANRIAKAKYESDKLKKENLKKNLKTLEKRIKKTQNLLADCDLENQQTVLSMLGDFRKEESEIQDKIARIIDTSFKPYSKTEIRDFAQKTRGDLQTLSLEKKRNLLYTFIQGITVTADRKVSIEYDLPRDFIREMGAATFTIEGRGSSIPIYAPRAVKAANRRLLVVALGVDSPLYHGRFIQFSRGELEELKERILRAAAPPEKQIFPGQIPFGYKVENGRLVKEKKEQQIIRKIQRWKGENLSLREIARRLNQEKVSGKNGGRWAANTVKKIIDHVN